MKKTFKITLSVLALFALSFQTYAASCDGGELLFCGDEIHDYIESAKQNCCAGSVIPTFDYCNGVPGNIYVHVDGPNSSCAPD